MLTISDFVAVIGLCITTFGVGFAVGCQINHYNGHKKS